jgi:hypothetical protein
MEPCCFAATIEGGGEDGLDYEVLAATKLKRLSERDHCTSVVFGPVLVCQNQTKAPRRSHLGITLAPPISASYPGETSAQIG